MQVLYLPGFASGPSSTTAVAYADHFAKRGIAIAAALAIAIAHAVASPIIRPAPQHGVAHRAAPGAELIAAERLAAARVAVGVARARRAEAGRRERRDHAAVGEADLVGGALAVVAALVVQHVMIRKLLTEPSGRVSAPILPHC